MCRAATTGLTAGCVAVWVVFAALATGSAAGGAALWATSVSGAVVTISGVLCLRLMPTYRVFRHRPMGRVAAVLLGTAIGAAAVGFHPATLTLLLSKGDLDVAAATGLVALGTAVAATVLAAVAAGDAWDERRLERQWTSRVHPPTRHRRSGAGGPTHAGG